MGRHHDDRWLQRLNNVDRGLGPLRATLANGPAPLNELQREGVVQWFEHALELAWKTITDYLEDSGVVRTAITPRQWTLP